MDLQKFVYKLTRPGYSYNWYLHKYMFPCWHPLAVLAHQIMSKFYIMSLHLTKAYTSQCYVHMFVLHDPIVYTCYIMHIAFMRSRPNLQLLALA